MSITNNRKYPRENSMRLDRLRQTYPQQWRSQSARLLRDTRSVTVPDWRYGTKREMSARLLTLIQWLDTRLAWPVCITRDGLFVRDITVMDCLRFRVNYAERYIEFLFREGSQWYFSPAYQQVDLDLPLAGQFWLEPVLYQSGVKLPEPEYDSTLSTKEWDLINDDWADKEDWLCATAFDLLYDDPRFQLLRGDLHQSLMLDPVLTELALRCRSTGPGCSTRLYSLVWQHEYSLRRVADVCPGLLPLLAAYLDQAQEGVIPSCPLSSFRKVLLSDYGLEPATWIYLVQYGCGLFRELWAASRYRRPFVTAVSFLKLLQRAFLPPLPPPFVLRGLFSLYGESVSEIEKCCGIPEAVLRCVFLEGHKLRLQSATDSFLCNVLLVCNWAEVTRPVLDKTQRHAGWPLLLRLARDWERELRLRVETKNISWSCVLGEYRERHLVVRPLTSAVAVLEEGIAMRHCVYSYVGKCVKGTMRIFSVRDADTDKRLATIVIREVSGDRWNLVDARGFANRHVDSTIREIGLMLADAYPDLLLDNDGSVAA